MKDAISKINEAYNEVTSNSSPDYKKGDIIVDSNLNAYRIINIADGQVYLDKWLPKSHSWTGFTELALSLESMAGLLKRVRLITP